MAHAPGPVAAADSGGLEGIDEIRRAGLHQRVERDRRRLVGESRRECLGHGPGPPPTPTSHRGSPWRPQTPSTPRPTDTFTNPAMIPRPAAGGVNGAIARLFGSGGKSWANLPPVVPL